MVAEAVVSFTRQNAADQIAAVLHQQILSGDLQSGAALREVDLAKEFTVARNTIREALRLLTMEGLATHAVHHGVRVRTFNADEIRDLYGERRIMQSAVAPLAGHLTTDQIEHLRDGVRQTSQHLQEGRGQAWMTGNIGFHQQLVQCLGNLRLDRTFGALMREVRLVLVSLERQPSNLWDLKNMQLVDALTVDDNGVRYQVALKGYLDLSLSEVLAANSRQNAVADPGSTVDLVVEL